MSALLVVLGAAVGGPVRYVLAHTLDRRWPAGTLLANAGGSFLIGCFAGLSLGGEAWALLGTGFCGAFTTFSSFAVQTVDPGGWSGRRGAGIAYGTVTVALCLVLCAVGFWLIR